MEKNDKQKEIKLRAFKIENNVISKKNSGLLELLLPKLENSKVKDRLMLLNKDDPKKEEDLISDYNKTKEEFITGAMLRIMESSETPSIPDNLFDESKFVISELNLLEVEESKIYKDHYYFLLNNHYIITNLQGSSTITRFQTYINWLLQEERGSHLFEFNPLMVVRGDLQLNELKHIKVQDHITNKANEDKTESISQRKIVGLTKDLIFNLFKEVETLKNIELEKFVSAELLIKFSKPKDITKEEYQKFLGAYLKPISDTENVIFVPKKGSPIKSSEILEVKTVKIDLTESNKISEPNLFQEMEKYLIELIEKNEI